MFLISALGIAIAIGILYYVICAIFFGESKYLMEMIALGFTILFCCVWGYIGYRLAVLILTEVFK